MTQLEELLERVEAGDAPPFVNAIEKYAFWQALETSGGRSPSEAYYGSLDAAKSLHEALLPEYWFTIYGSAATVEAKADTAEYDGKAKGNPARAWLIAILKALISEQQAKETGG